MRNIFGIIFSIWCSSLYAIPGDISHWAARINQAQPTELSAEELKQIDQQIENFMMNKKFNADRPAGSQIQHSFEFPFSFGRIPKGHWLTKPFDKVHDPRSWQSPGSWLAYLASVFSSVLNTWRSTVAKPSSHEVKHDLGEIFEILSIMFNEDKKIELKKVNVEKALVGLDFNLMSSDPVHPTSLSEQEKRELKKIVEKFVESKKPLEQNKAFVAFKLLIKVDHIHINLEGEIDNLFRRERDGMIEFDTVLKDRVVAYWSKRGFQSSPTRSDRFAFNGLKFVIESVKSKSAGGEGNFAPALFIEIVGILQGGNLQLHIASAANSHLAKIRTKLTNYDPIAKADEDSHGIHTVVKMVEVAVGSYQYALIRKVCDCLGGLQQPILLSEPNFIKSVKSGFALFSEFYSQGLARLKSVKRVVRPRVRARGDDLLDGPKQKSPWWWQEVCLDDLGRSLGLADIRLGNLLDDYFHLDENQLFFDQLTVARIHEGNIGGQKLIMEDRAKNRNMVNAELVKSLECSSLMQNLPVDREAGARSDLWVFLNRAVLNLKTIHAQVHNNRFLMSRRPGKIALGEFLKNLQKDSFFEAFELKALECRSLLDREEARRRDASLQGFLEGVRSVEEEAQDSLLDRIWQFVTLVADLKSIYATEFPNMFDQFFSGSRFKFQHVETGLFHLNEFVRKLKDLKGKPDAFYEVQIDNGFINDCNADLRRLFELGVFNFSLNDFRFLYRNGKLNMLPVKRIQMGALDIGFKIDLLHAPELIFTIHRSQSAELPKYWATLRVEVKGVRLKKMGNFSSQAAGFLAGFAEGGLDFIVEAKLVEIEGKRFCWKPQFWAGSDGIKNILLTKWLEGTVKNNFDGLSPLFSQVLESLGLKLPEIQDVTLNARGILQVQLRESRDPVSGDSQSVGLSDDAVELVQH
jgi:hypothetical protein